MRLPEYDHLDALGLAALVARGEVSAPELLEAALARADARNPPLNAIVRRADEAARARARRALPASPLAGVPFLLKDLLAAWKGHPLTGGSRLTASRVADHDAEIVRRLEAAGLVLFGQTNTPELGILAVTEPELHGPARNPWHLDHTPGGSSGGAAAAVAARIVPAAHGNDTGGSLRIPASACGVFALKPSRGRVTLAPDLGESNSGLTTEGVVTRSVRDTAALLDVIGGPAPGDPHALPPPPRPFLAELAAPPGRLRVALVRDPLFARRTDPACAAALDGAARLLESLGHEVTEARPPFSRDALVHAYLVALAAQVAADVELGARAVGRRPRDRDLEPETATLAAAGRALSARDLVLAEAEMHAATRAIAAFLERHDAVLTSTTAQPAPRIGALRPTRAERLALRAVARMPARPLLERLFATIGDRTFEKTGNTMLWNQTGQPAVSVPFAFPEGGVPIGVQLAGRRGEDALLLRLAAQLEAARPWAERLPPGLAGLAAAPAPAPARHTV